MPEKVFQEEGAAVQRPWGMKKPMMLPSWIASCCLTDRVRLGSTQRGAGCPSERLGTVYFPAPSSSLEDPWPPQCLSAFLYL